MSLLFKLVRFDNMRLALISSQCIQLTPQIYVLPSCYKLIMSLGEEELKRPFVVELDEGDCPNSRKIFVSKKLPTDVGEMGKILTQAIKDEQLSYSSNAIRRKEYKVKSVEENKRVSSNSIEDNIALLRAVVADKIIRNVKESIAMAAVVVIWVVINYLLLSTNLLIISMFNFAYLLIFTTYVIVAKVVQKTYE